MISHQQPMPNWLAVFNSLHSRHVCLVRCWLHCPGVVFACRPHPHPPPLGLEQQLQQRGGLQCAPWTLPQFLFWLHPPDRPPPPCPQQATWTTSVQSSAWRRSWQMRHLLCSEAWLSTCSAFCSGMGLAPGPLIASRRTSYSKQQARCSDKQEYMIMQHHDSSLTLCMSSAQAQFRRASQGL